MTCGIRSGVRGGPSYLVISWVRNVVRFRVKNDISCEGEVCIAVKGQGWGELCRELKVRELGLF